jgi:hypothetical protein
MPAQTLADANAVAQRLTPDLSTLLYLSDNALYAVPAEGGEPQALETAENTSGKIDVAFPETGSSAAYTVDGAIYRIQPAAGSASKVSGAASVQGSASYDGAGTAILFLDDAGALLRVPGDEVEPEQVASAVTGFWPIANSSKILVITDGILKVLAFDAPDGPPLLRLEGAALTALTQSVSGGGGPSTAEIPAAGLVATVIDLVVSSDAATAGCAIRCAALSQAHSGSERFQMSPSAPPLTSTLAISAQAGSRSNQGDKALMALSIDNPAPPELVDELHAAGFDEARFIDLGGT